MSGNCCREESFVTLSSHHPTLGKQSISTPSQELCAEQLTRSPSPELVTSCCSWWFQGCVAAGGVCFPLSPCGEHSPHVEQILYVRKTFNQLFINFNAAFDCCFMLWESSINVVLAVNNITIYLQQQPDYSQHSTPA